MENNKNRIPLIAAFFWFVLFLINFGHGAGWSGVYSILIKEIGSASLSYFFLFSALGGFALNVALMFFADLLSNERLVQTSFVSFILILSADLWAIHAGDILAEPAHKSLLIFLAVLIIAVPSVFIIQTWNLINKTFSPKSAANVYPILITAPLIGSIMGGATANRLPKYFATDQLLVTWIVCIFLAIVTTFLLNRQIKAGTVPAPKEKIDRSALVGNFKEGLRHYKTSAFALDLSVVFMSFWLVCTIIDFCYAQTLEKTYSSSEEMASFYGGYVTAASITALLIQTFLGSKLLKKIGVRYGFMFLPASQLACFLLMLAFPGLWPIVAAMYMQTLIGMSVQSNSVQVSYNIFASSVRGKIRTLLEGVINPLGGVIASLIIIALNRLQKDGGMAVESILPAFGVFFSAVWLFSTFRIRKSYLKEIRWTYDYGNAQDKKDACEAIQIERQAVGGSGIPENMVQEISGGE